jgi:iron complex outermembrane receptor protein
LARGADWYAVIATTLLSTAAQATDVDLAGTGQSAPTALPAVTVTGAQETAHGPSEDYVANRAATGTKTDTPIIETPQSISVVTDQQMLDQGAQTLQEAVRYSAGVTSEAYGLDNRGDWLFIRGTEHTQYYDGLRTQSQSWNMPRPEPYALERIEILRGPSSVLYGSSTAGGMVNVVSKRPQAEAAHELTVQYGSRDHKQVGMDFTGPITVDGDWLYRLVAMGYAKDTQVDFTDSARWLISPSLTWQPRDRTNLTLRAHVQRDYTDGATAAFPPHSGTILPNPNGELPTDLFTGEPDYDRFDIEQNFVGWEFEHGFDEHWTVRQNGRYSVSSLDYRTLYPNIFGLPIGSNQFQDANQRLVDRWGWANTEQMDVFLLDNQVQSQWYLGPMQHTVLVGIDYMDVNQDNRNGFSFSATLFDLFDPVYGNVPDSELAVAVDQSDQFVSQVGIYAQDQIKFGQHWVLMGGLRHDWLENEIEDGDEQSDTALTGRVGAVFLADNGLAPYASYSQSFNPEIGQNATGEAFEPKRGEQIEVGVRYQPKGSNSMVTVAAYDIDETNRLASDPNNPNEQVQLAGADIWGVEVEAVANVTRNLDLIASYAYTHARTHDAAGVESEIAEVHPHTAALWSKYEFSIGGVSGFSIGGGVRYLGSTTDETDTLDVPSVTLFDALFAYETGPWRLGVTASNITDETYIASCLARGDCWYGSRANVVGTVSYRF